MFLLCSQLTLNCSKSTIQTLETRFSSVLLLALRSPGQVLKESCFEKFRKIPEETHAMEPFYMRPTNKSSPSQVFFRKLC